VYVTEDFGQTWKSLRGNLPTGSSRVLREDVVNPNLLYLGTEFTLWTSLDRGQSWHKLNSNLPTVAVHEIAVHPTVGEIVAATHGRSLWVLDVIPLRQITGEVVKERAHLFEPGTLVRWRSEPGKGSPFGQGSRNFTGQNPPRGAQIYYSLAAKAEKISLKVMDVSGKTVRELQVKGDPGMHRVTWDLLSGGPPRQGGPGGGGARPKGGDPAQPAPGQPVPAGSYRVVLSVDGVELARNLRVEPDPTVPGAIVTPEEEPGNKNKAPMWTDH
jgi:hypothetical protein